MKEMARDVEEVTAGTKETTRSEIRPMTSSEARLRTHGCIRLLWLSHCAKHIKCIDTFSAHNSPTSVVLLYRTHIGKTMAQDCTAIEAQSRAVFN